MTVSSIIHRKVCARQIAVNFVCMVNALKRISANVIMVINLPMGRIVFVSQFVSYRVKMRNALSRTSARARTVTGWPMKVNRMSVIVVCIALKSMGIAIVWTRSIAFQVIAFEITFHRFARKPIA